MITKSTGYQSSDGQFHPSLEDAQEHELTIVFAKAAESAQTDQDASCHRMVMANKDKIIDILTMKPNSLPKARRINGGTKKRQPKHIAEQFAMPLGETPAKATA